jgi:hypothetical protein
MPKARALITSRSKRTLFAHACVAALLCAMATTPGAASAKPEAPGDHLEPGKQGETLPGEAKVLPCPYSKGVRVVGHSDIGKRSGNLIMAWSD